MAVVLPAAGRSTHHNTHTDKAYSLHVMPLTNSADPSPSNHNYTIDRCPGSPATRSSSTRSPTASSMQAPT